MFQNVNCISSIYNNKNLKIEFSPPSEEFRLALVGASSMSTFDVLVVKHEEIEVE